MIIQHKCKCKITATGSALGAVITGLNVNIPIQSEIILMLKKALLKYQVLIFKEQLFNDEQLVQFATYFGSIFIPLSNSPVLASQTGENPVIVTIANAAPEYGKKAYLSNQEVLPHSDHQWTPYPSCGSMLYALEIPEIGGNTQWINLIKAYDELDPETKKKITNLKLITYNPFFKPFGTVFASYHQTNEEPTYEPIFPHPLVRTHPDTGKKILYLNSTYEVEIEGISYIEGVRLIEKLRKHITQPHFSYTHQWSVGDLVYWDNQCTLHYRPAFDSQARRVLKRISLAGSRPF